MAGSVAQRMSNDLERDATRPKRGAAKPTVGWSGGLRLDNVFSTSIPPGDRRDRHQFGRRGYDIVFSVERGRKGRCAGRHGCSKREAVFERLKWAGERGRKGRCAGGHGRSKRGDGGSYCGDMEIGR